MSNFKVKLKDLIKSTKKRIKNRKKQGFYANGEGRILSGLRGELLAYKKIKKII